MNKKQFDIAEKACKTLVSRVLHGISSSLNTNLPIMIPRRFEFGNERYGIKPNKQNDGRPSLVESGALKASMSRRPTILIRNNNISIKWNNTPPYADTLKYKYGQDFTKLTVRELDTIISTAFARIRPVRA